MIRNPWAREHARTPNRYIWGTEASEPAHQMSALLPPGARVLDLHCGEGRDGAFLAQRGFDVTGVDVARLGLAAKAERLACGAIHDVPRAVRAKLVPRLKTITREHGPQAHVVFTDRAVYVEKGERTDYFAPGELTAFDPDWAILTREQWVTDCDQDGTIHRHSMEQFVARSPYRPTPAA